jgi:hypothetical protein
VKLPKRQSAAKFKDAARVVELPDSQLAWPIPLAALIATAWAWVITIFFLVAVSSLVWITTADSITNYADSIYTSFALVLLAHSIPVAAGGLVFSIPPLVITLLVVWLIKKSTQWAVRSTLITNLANVLILIFSMMVCYASLALVVMAFAAPVAEINASRVLIHSGLWALVGTLWGILRSPGEIGPAEKRNYTTAGERTNFAVKPQSPHSLLIDLWQSTSSAFQYGFAFSVRSLLIQFLFAFGFATTLFVFTLNDMYDVISLVATDTMSTVVLVLSFVLYIPNIVIWYLALLIGPGVVVGGGSAVTLITQAVGALPTLPMFTVIPYSLPWAARLLILIPALSSFLVAATFGRKQFGYKQVPTINAISIAIYSGLVSAFFAFILSAQASGAFGAGRFLEVGINLWQIALWAFAWGLLGTLAGFILPNFISFPRSNKPSKSKN